jgi:hypothetical protein
MIEPPLPIPLTDQQLKAIGETCAILGQIDLFMQETVMWLLNVSVPTAAAIMGSTDARARAGVWKQIVETKCQSTQTKDLAETALKQFEKLSGQRNDFVHAFFGTVVERVHGGITEQAIYLHMHPTELLAGRQGTPVAIKVRNRKHRPASAIETLRDEAATAAHLFHQIVSSTFFQWRDEHGSSRGKFAQQRPPHPAKPKQS